MCVRWMFDFSNRYKYKSRCVTMRRTFIEKTFSCIDFRVLTTSGLCVVARSRITHDQREKREEITPFNFTYS